MPTASAHRLLLLLAAGAIVLVGCGDDDEEDGAASTTTVAASSAPGDLPALDELAEDDLDTLQAVYGPPLAALDLRVTRGGVVPYRGGNHLQLYVEPTTDTAANPPQVYLDRMLTSFQAILPVLFDAYPELDSFDLCQEPVPSTDREAGYEPEEPEDPVTLLLLTRRGYESVDDWSTATLDDLVAAAAEELGGHVAVTPEIEALPGYPATT